MKMHVYALTAFLTLSSSLLGANVLDYARDIKPVLKERCYACHGALKQKAKLRLDMGAFVRKGGRNGPAVEPSNVDESPLIERVTAVDDATRMPPMGKPLTAKQIDQLKAWIREGAESPADEKPEEDPRKHWAFQRPVRPTVPASQSRTWGRNAIDDLLGAEHTRHGLRATPAAPLEILLRRVYLDLIGLPPTGAELHAFLNDHSPDAYEKVVNRLLDSPQYGERWARHWMDVWRYSDWYGRRSVPDVMNSYPRIWRWRDWIVRSLNEDKGYDRMVQEMLAADEICPADDANVVATGFLVRNWFKWNYNQWMRDDIEHTAKAFLGLTFNCCHCHDHKYDPISQQEYFQFRAFFEPLELRHDRWPGEADPGPFVKYVYTVTYGPIQGGMIRVFDEKLDAQTYMYSGGDERNRIAKKPPVQPAGPAFLGGDRLSITPVSLPAEVSYPGLKPFVQCEEIAKREQAVVVARSGGGTHLATAEAELQAIKARVAADNVKYARTPGNAEAQARAASKAERFAALCAATEKLVLAEQGLVAAVNKTEQAKAGMEKDRAAAAAKQAELQVTVASKAVDTAQKALALESPKYTPLSPIYPTKSTGRRKALALWLANRDNPLTARVAVNHLWRWHFGRPLVETAFNFGRSGKPPTHPQLLDWLAVELMDNGWSTKHLHRLIVTSEAYRMQSHFGGPADPSFKADPDNRYLWHFPTQRMEAEVLRDSILHVAGTLDPKMGGVEIPHEQGLASHRRSLYFAHHGESKMEFLELFDGASPAECYQRSSSVLPQQALALANSDLPLREGRLMAHRLWAQVAGQPSAKEAFLRAAFEEILGRAPTAPERMALAGFLNRQEALLQGAKSSAQVPGAPAADPAMRARENLMIVLLNHNDFVTIR